MSKKQKIKYKRKAEDTNSQVKNPESQKRFKSGNKIDPGNKFFIDHWKQLVVLIILAIGLYGQTFSFKYVLDDRLVIENNKFTQKGISGIPEIFANESFKGSLGEQKELVEGGRYRPLSIASFALEKSITGGSASFSHLINIILYTLTGIFLYRVLLILLPGNSNLFINVPFAAAALFVVHPLHVEVVANVKGRDEIFAFIAELAVLYFSLKWLQDKKSRYLIYSGICFLLGIFSKENLVTFLLIVPITAYFFTHSSISDKIKLTLPLLVATLIYLFIRYAVLGYMFSGSAITNLMNNPFYGMGFSEKTATIFYTLLLYLKLLIYPYPLTHDYYPYHIPIMHWSDWHSILSLILNLGLLMYMIFTWKRKSVLSYCIAFYFITLSIVTNLFISVGTFMNERFLYHSSLGFCIALSWLLIERINVDQNKRILGNAVLVIGVIAFSILSYLRIPDWKTNDTLNKAAIKISYNSARANLFYGVLIREKDYLTLPKDAGAARKRAILDSLKPYFDKAIQILPSYTSANSMKAGIAGEYHKLDNKLEPLLKSFEEVNLTGTYEKFIVDYLHYINGRVNNLTDAKLLQGFYQRMIPYYDATYKNTTLPGEYRSLLKEVQEKVPGLQ